LLAPDRSVPELGDVNLLDEAVREAGALAMTMFRQSVRKWIKPDGSPVTEADRAVDKLMQARLRAARPQYGWLSEETPDDSSRLSSASFWLLDPIDGTRSFLEGGDEWCIAAALVVNGRPACSAVYRPVAEQFYEAFSGGGSRLNGVPIAVSDQRSLSGAKVAGGGRILRKLAQSAKVTPENQSSVPLALRLCFVASGVYDGAISGGRKSDWDLAAGDLIAHEAGGRVTGLDGRAYNFDRPETWQSGMLAGNRFVHGQLVSFMGTGDGEETS
jgi:myo-inositol-1(or 4)-monophosphatase